MPTADRAPIRPHRLVSRVVTALLVLLAAPPVVAESPDLRWAVYGYGLIFEPTGDQTILNREPVALTQVVDDQSAGFGIELERRWTRRLSLAAGIFFVDLDTALFVAGEGSGLGASRRFGVYAPYLGADWHFSTDSNFDLFLGAYVAQLNFEDVAFFKGTSDQIVLRYDDDFGFGLRFGVNWSQRQGSPWSLRAEARYLAVLLESEIAGEDLSLDPLVLTAGIAYRW